MNTATAIANAFIPAACQKIDNLHWLLFYNNGTFDAFKSMPNALSYEGRTFVKAGWNSDTNSVHYKEGEPALAV